MIFEVSRAWSDFGIQSIAYLDDSAALLVLCNNGALLLDVQNDYQLVGNWSTQTQELPLLPYSVPSVVAANNSVLITGTFLTENNSILFHSLDIMHNLTETGNISVQIGNSLLPAPCAFMIPETNMLAILLLAPNCTFSLFTYNLPLYNNSSAVIQNITENPWGSSDEATIVCKLFTEERKVAIYITDSVKHHETEYVVYVDTDTFQSHTVEWQKSHSSEFVLGFSDSNTVHTSVCVPLGDVRVCSVATLNTSNLEELSRTFVPTQPFNIQADTVYSDVDNVVWLLSRPDVVDAELIEIVKVNLSSSSGFAIAAVSFINATAVFAFELESDARTLSIQTIHGTSLFDSQSLGLLEYIPSSFGHVQYTHLISDKNGSAYFLDEFSATLYIFHYLNGTVGTSQFLTNITGSDYSESLATLSSSFVFLFVDNILVVLDRFTLEVMNVSNMSFDPKLAVILDVAVSDSEDALYVMLFTNEGNVSITIIKLPTLMSNVSQFWMSSKDQLLSANIFFTSDVFLEVFFNNGLLIKVVYVWVCRFCAYITKSVYTINNTKHLLYLAQCI